jgi:ABC-2 type transport system ATP-binding protein
MQQRLGLGVALLGDPDVVFLDEPTSALDPVARMELRPIIRGLRDRGITVFLNSHLLTEVEQVCDRVAIIDQGRLLTSGLLADLLRPGGVRLRVVGLSQSGRDAIGQMGPVEADGAWLIVRNLPEQQIPALVDLVVGDQARLYAVEPLQPSLEDRFRQLLLGDVHGQ